MIMGITGFRLGVGCSIYEKNKMLSKPPMGGNFFDTFGNSLLFQVQNVTARLLSWPFRDRDGLILTQYMSRVLYLPHSLSLQWEFESTFDYMTTFVEECQSILSKFASK